jgi:hypothetical protein
VTVLLISAIVLEPAAAGRGPHDPGRDQQPRRVGEPAGERRDGEHRDACEEHPPPADQVAEPPAEQEQAAEHQRVRVHHPRQARRGEAEVGADARQRYERIVPTAREVFLEQGIDAALDDIAKRARVGPGTLYRHFPTRDVLTEAV